MIRNILFDLGGVIMTIDQPQAVRRFKEIGLSDAETRLDPYTQKGPRHGSIHTLRKVSLVNSRRAR